MVYSTSRGSGRPVVRETTTTATGVIKSGVRDGAVSETMELERKRKTREEGLWTTYLHPAKSDSEAFVILSDKEFMCPPCYLGCYVEGRHVFCSGERAIHC